MSLKAKLEAVIYAAEEPVTLAQLAGMFADEALEWGAVQEAAAAKARQETPGAAMPQPDEDFPYLDLETVAEESSGSDSARRTVSPATGVESGYVSAESSAASDDSGPMAANVESEEAADESPAKAAIDADARQQAKARDRAARAAVKQILTELIAEYAGEGRGIEIREIAGGYRMATKPEFHDAVRSFVKSQKPPIKLSLPALETLAVIAYKQPVTAPEVNEIRGVDSSAVFGSLLARKLITTAGRKPVVGRPILYKTTREFLLRFGLKDVSELPSMEEFEKMAASELEADETLAAAPANGEVEEFNPDLSLEPIEAGTAPVEASRPEAELSPAGSEEGGAPAAGSAE